MGAVARPSVVQTETQGGDPGWTPDPRSRSSVTSAKVAVNGVHLHYLRTGEGEHAVLLLPGMLGLEALTAALVCYVVCDVFMITLQFKKVSLLGWSDGGITALIAAAKYPSYINKVMVWGANAYVTDEDKAIYEGIRDVSKWSERTRKPLEALYGIDYFARTCEKWVDGINQFKRLPGGNICRHLLPLVQCPTLVVHGERDPLVPRSHADFIHQHTQLPVTSALPGVLCTPPCPCLATGTQPSDHNSDVSPSCSPVTHLSEATRPLLVPSLQLSTLASVLGCRLYISECSDHVEGEHGQHMGRVPALHVDGIPAGDSGPGVWCRIHLQVGAREQPRQAGARAKVHVCEELAP
ncbi:valacyclovir hydrolase-like protein [Camelus ferus]|nr:valacyclovir hydrolase-like protein [Camelus ferus]